MIMVGSHFFDIFIFIRLEIDFQGSKIFSKVKRTIKDNFLSILMFDLDSDNIQ